MALESGRYFIGESFGADGQTCGEVVFNTSMTGYQEILTDPSYRGQIVVMTYPHIGNYGVNEEDIESRRPFLAGFVMREASTITSNWRATGSLRDYLMNNNIPAITGVDTRAITKHIREAGAMRGIISSIELVPKNIIKKVEQCPAVAGRDLAREVTCEKPYEFKGGCNGSGLYRVAVLDYGVKLNILRHLVQRKCHVTVMPAKASSREILAVNPDGILLSNGPGDPAAVTYAVDAIRELIQKFSGASVSPIPIFGICLGHQLLGLALGCTTYKLKFGHRGANHPVKNLLTGKIEITTQNHGFAVRVAQVGEAAWDIPENPDIEVTHINLNDQTCEGLRHKKLPIFSVQYHPEASAGPHDANYLFDQFIELMKCRMPNAERRVSNV